MSRRLASLALVLLAGCSPPPRPAPRGAGSAQTPSVLRLSVRASEHRPEAREFEIHALGLLFEAARDRTGLEVDFLPAPETIAEQLRRIEAAEADAFLLSPFTYLVARERFGVEPWLAVQKRGHQSLYSVELVAARSSGISRVEELRGHRMVLDVETHSNPIRFWLGHDLLARAGLVTGGDAPPFAYALEVLRDPAIDRHRALLEVLEGRADAAPCFHAERDESGQARDGRWFHREAFPDVLERLPAIARSASVPYPVLAFRPDLDREVAHRFAEGVLAFLATEEGRQMAFRELRPGSEGLGPVRESDFDDLRRLVATYAIDVQAQLPHDDDTF